MARLVQPTRPAAARMRSLSALFYGICVSPRHLYVFCHTQLTLSHTLGGPRTAPRRAHGAPLASHVPVDLCVSASFVCVLPHTIDAKSHKTRGVAGVSTRGCARMLGRTAARTVGPHPGFWHRHRQMAPVCGCQKCVAVPVVRDVAGSGTAAVRCALSLSSRVPAGSVCVRVICMCSATHN